MKLVCDKRRLLEAIGVVEKTVVRNQQQPLLGCICIKADADGTVEFTTTDTTATTRYKMDMDVTEQGRIALEATLLRDIIKKLPDGNIRIETNSVFETTLSAGRSKFRIRGLSAENFPKFPECRRDRMIEISQSTLKYVIQKTLPFAAVTEGKRPVFTGILFELKSGINTITAVSTDIHRLAYVSCGCEGVIEEDLSAIIPASDLKNIEKLLEFDDDKIRVYIDDTRAKFEFGNYEYSVRTLEGTFIRYEPIIGGIANTTSTQINKAEFARTLDRINLMLNSGISKETKPPVKLTVGKESITLEAVSNAGSATDTVLAKGDSELTIGFNCKFLLDAMNVCGEDKLNLHFTNPSNGMFIKPVDGGDYVYMILPVRLHGQA